MQCRKDGYERLGLSEEDVELSMEMSSDFDKAVATLMHGWYNWLVL